MTSIEPVADPGGANPAMAPPSKLAMEFGPLWDRKSNGIVILLKIKDSGPPVAMSAKDLAPPMEKYHIKHKKVDD